jgi:hypothetical protein
MKYVLGLLLGIGLIVLTFILIFRAFSGGDTPKQQSIDLSDYATTSAVMRFTIDGPTNSDQKHGRVRITVSKDKVLYEQVQGYEGKLVQTKEYANNAQAFGTFLRSLELAKFDKGDTKVDKDERGYCATGRRYLYEAIDGGDTLFRWWNTSCSASQGSYDGVTSSVQTLFKKQVPDYDKLIGKANI